MSTQPNSENSFQLYRRLLRYAWPYKWVFLISIIGMILAALTQPALASMMKPLLDGGFIEKDPQAIRWVPLILVGLFFIRGLGNFSAQFSFGWIGRKAIYDIRDDLFTRMISLPTSYYDANASGVLISKIIFDVEQIAAAITKAVFVLVQDSVTVIALLAYMFYSDWKMTLVFIVVSPILALFVRAMSRRFRKTSLGIQQSLGRISNVTQEGTAGQRVIKAFGAHKAEIKAFNLANEKNRKQATRKAAVASSSVPIMELLAATAMAMVVYYALNKAQAGQLTVGGFASYFLALSLMMNPAKRLAKVNETLQTGLAAAQSIFDLLDQPAEEDNGTRTLEKVKGRIEYKDVSLRYAASEDMALKHINFTIEPGKIVALVGTSGSGKTTIANLLPRFYFTTQGEILIDSVNINELKLANLRKHIALVSQEIVLFNDTIHNNIAYGSEEAIDEARLQAAVKAAHVAEFVSSLPDGLETEVGEKGVRLSGGQRQRIAIARAIYKDAPILVLDEAMSALDTESERYVQDAMQKLMRNRSTLVIAHRLSTIENADTIVVLAQGQVVESGSHKELLEKNGVYAGLYHAQYEHNNATLSAI